MKKIIVILTALALTITVSAQKRGRSNVRPRAYVVIGGGYSPYYSPFYNPYSYPYRSVYNNNRQTRLDFEIADIKGEYRARIKDVRYDKSFSKAERKKQIRNLKAQEDKAIREARKNYYLRRSPGRY